MVPFLGASLTARPRILKKLKLDFPGCRTPTITDHDSESPKRNEPRVRVGTPPARPADGRVLTCRLWQGPRRAAGGRHFSGPRGSGFVPEDGHDSEASAHWRWPLKLSGRPARAATAHCISSTNDNPAVTVRVNNLKSCRSGGQLDLEFNTNWQ